MDNKWIEEDFEREFLKEQMYILAKKKEQEDQWREEIERLPAKINVITPKTKSDVKLRKRRKIKRNNAKSGSINSEINTKCES